jgi:hypothetical protein
MEVVETTLKPMDRLSEFIQYMRLSPRAFEMSIGISNGYFAKQMKNGSIGSNILQKIHDKYKILDIKWIITGEGQMIIKRHIKRIGDPEIDEMKAKIELLERKFEGLISQVAYNPIKIV